MFVEHLLCANVLVPNTIKKKFYVKMKFLVSVFLFLFFLTEDMRLEPQSWEVVESGFQPPSQSHQYP